MIYIIGPRNLKILILAICAVGMIVLFNTEFSDDDDKSEGAILESSKKTRNKSGGEGENENYKEVHLKGMKATKDCLMEQIDEYNAEAFWNKSTDIVNSCLAINHLNITPFENNDETKFHIPSRFKDSDCKVVTLGVGMDTGAEEKMAKMMPNCHFYGADPVNEKNKELYEKVGSFYNTAVGVKNGFLKNTVLHTKYKGRNILYRAAGLIGIPVYTDRRVSTREFFEFIQEDLKLKVVDQLLIDIEMAEFELTPKLLKKNTPHDLTICQINIEFHPQNRKTRKAYYNFLRDLVEEGHILPLKATLFKGIDVKRLYFLNVGDKICRDRYFYHAPKK